MRPPANLINIALYGLPAAAEARHPIMPGFANALDDNQLADLLRYLRGRFSGKGPWNDIEISVHDARNGDGQRPAGPADAARYNPAVPK